MKVLKTEVSYHGSYPSESGKNLFDVKSWPFLLEEKFTYVDRLEDADIIPLNDKFDLYKIGERIKKKQICLVLNTFHIDDTYDLAFFKHLVNHNSEKYPNINFVFLHKNKSVPDMPGLLYYDSMFNRQKLYFQEYHKVEEWQKNFNKPNGDFFWSHKANKEVYRLNELTKDFSEDFKNIISPGLIYNLYVPPRMRFRAGLRGWLEMNCDANSLYHKNDKDLFMPNNPSPHIKYHLSAGVPRQGGFWYPLADEYYKKTMFSVYIETLTMSYFDTKCVTEKTFDPLIKGNFIIPFGYPGFLKDVLEYGFLLPDGVDYAYDSIENDEVRFQKFLRTVKSVADMNIEDTKKFYKSNKHLLQHNRNIFLKKPYHTFYDRLSAILEKIRANSNVSNL